MSEFNFPQHLDESSLQQLSQSVWQLLDAATRDSQLGYHLPILATLDEAALPTQRIVVLRRVDTAERRIICHTDLRSPKVSQVKRCPDIHWLFYDPGLKLQLRIEATARVEADTPLADEQWDNSALSSRRCYLAPHAPSSQLEDWHSNLPDDFVERVPATEAESAPARTNFAIIVSTVKQIELLHLAAKGHQRLQISWSATGEINAQWLAA